MLERDDYSSEQIWYSRKNRITTMASMLSSPLETAQFSRRKTRRVSRREKIVCVSRGRKHERMRRNNEGHRCRSKAQITGDRADWHPSKPSQKGDKPLEAFFLENQWRLLFPINKIQRTTISHCSKSQTNFEIQHFDRYTWTNSALNYYNYSSKQNPTNNNFTLLQIAN